MSKLKFKPDEDASLPDKPLKDVGVLIAGATASYDEEPKLKGLKLSISLEARPTIEVFNSNDDIDEDAVLGVPKDAEDDFGPLKLPPIFSLNEKDAWVKYRFATKASASASAEFTFTELKVDADKEIIFADYRHHDRNASTRSTIIADLTNSLRTADDPRHFLDLTKKESEKDALLYAVRGQLTGSVSLSWSDVFSWTIGSLAQLLGPGQMLKVVLEPSASLTFNTAIRDDFRVIFTKAGADHVRIAICKSKSREVGVNAKAGATARWADPKQLQSVLKRIKESVLGELNDRLDEILEKANLDQLGEQELALVMGLMERLRLPGPLQTLESLKKQWKSLEKKIDDTFKKISEAKVAAAFEYEYLRIHTNEALLIADLPGSDLSNPDVPVLNKLLLCDIQSVLKHVESNPDSLKSYLRQDTLLRSHAWGFSLGIGSINFSGKDQKELKRVMQTNEKKEQRLAYLGKRGYEAETFQDAEQWTVDFKAQMPAFSLTPLTSEFDYGLYFRVLWNEKKLDEEEFKRCLDYGVIWRIFSAANALKLFEKFKNKLNKLEATLSAEIKIDGDAFRGLLETIMKDGGPSHGARSLAKAMPFMSKFDGRRNVGLRESSYTPLWLNYLNDPARTPAEYASRASSFILKQGHLEDEQDLAHFERTAHQPNPFTFAGQIQLQGNPIAGTFGDIAERWRNFLGALRILNQVSRPGHGEGHERIEKIFKSIAGFSDQWLYVRAAGAFIMDMVATHSDLLDEVERTFTIGFKGEKPEVVSGSASPN